MIEDLSEFLTSYSTASSASLFWLPLSEDMKFSDFAVSWKKPKRKKPMKFSDFAVSWKKTKRKKPMKFSDFAVSLK